MSAQEKMQFEEWVKTLCPWDREWAQQMVAEGGTSGGNPVLRGFLSPTEDINAVVTRIGAMPLELVDTTGNPQFFSFALEQARQTNPNGLMTSGKTVEELSQPGTVTFMCKYGLGWRTCRRRWRN